MIESGIAPQIVTNGVGLGTVIAVVVSWSRNRSILWAIFHGICSWLYVIYYIATDQTKNDATPTGRAGAIGVIILFMIFMILLISVLQRS